MINYGWIATALSLIYKIPQIFFLYRVKDISGLSFWSIMCQAASYIFYVIHGFVIDDLPIITMGCVSCFQSFILIGMYFYYKRPEETCSDSEP